MNIRIITYDLNKELNSDDYKGIITYIKQHNWARLSESSYAIETTKTPQLIYNDISKYLDDGDRVLILTLTTPYYGVHQKEVIDWLAAKL